MRDLLKQTPRSPLPHADDNGRTMAFPTRRDYLQQLKHHDLIASEAEFIADDILTEAVYLDWLLRPQVGCVFAQLLARPIHRTGFMTVVARGSSGAGKPIELATQIADLATEAVRDPSTEALTVLLPQVLDDQSLATLAWELGNKPGWKTELNRRWQKGLVLVGLRVEIKEKVFAETLGMGPFPTFPTTRQSPVTSLEIRTDPKRAKRSKLSRGYLAAHLADIPIDFLTNEEFRVRFSTHTPKLRKRILGTPSDQRAKAGVTYTIQAPIWDALKGQYSSQVVAGD